MKWHFKNKSIWGKLVIFFGTMFGVVLYSMSNLTGIKKDSLNEYNAIAISSSDAEKCFLEEYFLKEIKTPYNSLFFVLCVVGVFIILCGWKRFKNRYSDGIVLYNAGVGLLSATMLGYGFTTIFLLKAFSWEVVPAFSVGALMLALFVKNIIHYSKNKRIIKDEDEEDAKKNRIKKLLRVGIPSIIALGLSAFSIVTFSGTYSHIKKETMEEFWERYEDVSFLLNDEINENDYIVVKYVNYFNSEGRTISYEVVEQEIKNYISEDNYHSIKNCDNLWYCLEYFYSTNKKYNQTNVFSSLDYEWQDTYAVFVSKVKDKLLVDGLSSSEATHQQLDEACQYVYDMYVGQTPMIRLGDDEGELVVHIDIPESKNVDDIKVSWEGEGYRAYINDWYEMDNVGDWSINGLEPATTLEDGKIYYACVRMQLVLPYYASEESKLPLVSIDGVICEDVKTSVRGNDTVYADIWVIPGKDN